MVGESRVVAGVCQSPGRLRNVSPRRTFAADSIYVDHFQLTIRHRLLHRGKIYCTSEWMLGVRRFWVQMSLVGGCL